MVEYVSLQAVLDIVMQYCPDDDGSCTKADRDMREVLDEIEALSTTNVQTVNKWISVDKALPENDADCLVWYKCDTAFGKSESWGIANCSRCDWYTKHLNGDNIVVLYWQPLPEPPKQ